MGKQVYCNIEPHNRHLINSKDFFKMNEVASRLGLRLLLKNTFIYFIKESLGEKDWILRLDRRTAVCRIGYSMYSTLSKAQLRYLFRRMERIVNGVNDQTKNLAFDIIQKKSVNIYKDIIATKNYEAYLSSPADYSPVVNNSGEYFPEFVLTKAEYYFLKEVLLDVR